MKIKTKLIPLMTLALSFAIANTVSANFFQGFENNNNFWNLDPTNFPPAARVISGTDGIAAHSGGYFAEVPGPHQLCDPETGGSSYTNYGGYSISFPTGGYTTDLWIYLDPEGTTAGNDTRFDWIASAVSNPTCSFRRDFVFNSGFYNDTVPPGTGNRFVISAGNNSGRCNSFPKNPGHDPIVITTTGWYKFEGEFNNDGGVLSVTMRIYGPNGTTLVHEWAPLSDPSDIIGTTVGGNRYGWFASQEFSPYLAIDDSSLTGIQNYCNPPSGPVASQGYWMNHPNEWCEQSITIGGQTYTNAQAITLMQHATNRDMTYQMFAQLVAAELNVDCNHSDQSCVIAAIEAADLWMADHHVSSGVRANTSAWKAITSDYNTLVNYNEGLLCAPHMQ